MHDQSHGIVQLLGLGEGAMAAFVGENPDAGEDESLDGGVCNPRGESEVDVREERDEGDGEVDQGGEVEVIADDVGHGAEDRGLEAVCWNGIVDLLHGEVGQFELIAVEIDMLWFFS